MCDRDMVMTVLSDGPRVPAEYIPRPPNALSGCSRDSGGNRCAEGTWIPVRISAPRFRVAVWMMGTRDDIFARPESMRFPR